MFAAYMFVCFVSRTIGKDAVSCLVNVSAEETSVAALEDMCKAGIVNRCVSHRLERTLCFMWASFLSCFVGSLHSQGCQEG